MLHTKFREKLACRFWRRFLKGFYHIWAWRPPWSCDQHYVDFHFLVPESFHTKFGSEWHSSFRDQRTNGPVNPHLISWPSKAQNIQNLENILLRNFVFCFDSCLTSR